MANTFTSMTLVTPFRNITPRAVVIFVLLILPAALPAAAQPADEQEIRDVLARLFRGMEHGDSALVRKCFTSQVTIATVRLDKEGNPLLTRESSLDPFLRGVGTPHPEKWYEEVWDVKIAIDGPLAQVWCDYAFYLGNKFSHCGADAFQLFRDTNGWRIFHLADTRRTTGCNIPEAISRKHNPR